MTTFIGYSQNRKIGKPNILKVFGTTKPKSLNRIANCVSNYIYFDSQIQTGQKI
jgi:hypothetical protein